MLTPRNKYLAAIEAICSKYNLSADQVVGVYKKDEPRRAARNECYYVLHYSHSLNLTHIGRIMGRDRASVLNGIRSYKKCFNGTRKQWKEKRMGIPRGVCTDVRGARVNIDEIGLEPLAHGGEGNANGTKHFENEQEILTRCLELRNSPMQWRAVSKTVSKEFGKVIGEVWMRRRLDPGYRKKITKQWRQRRYKTGGESARTMFRMTQQQLKEHRLSLPEDTRTVTGKAFGDPLPGRSALDRMNG